MALYIPAHFQGENWRKVVNDYPLATLITGDVISHLPLILEERNGEAWLIGHLARANPQSKILDGANCTILFHGPNTYITPLWYQEYDVPTWNYVVVHMHGQAKALGEGATEAALRKISDRMEGPSGWKFGIPEDLAHSLHRAILGFEIQVKQVDAKFKLSQNRSRVDRSGVIEGLRKRGDARSQEVAEWMTEE